MKKETFLYVAESATYATGDQAVFQASNFIGAETPSATSTRFHFTPTAGASVNAAGLGATDSFTVTHTLDGHIEILKGVARAMATPGGFVVVQDDEGTAFSADGSSLGSTGFSDISYDAIASTGTAVKVSGTGVTVAI